MNNDRYVWGMWVFGIIAALIIVIVSLNLIELFSVRTQIIGG